MDSLHAIGFYASSGISVAGGLGVALLPQRDWRGVSLGVVGVGLAGIYFSLDAGFAAFIALLCYLGCAFVLAGPVYRAFELPMHFLWRQVGAVAAAALFAVLAYAAFRGDFVNANYFGGALNTAAIGRLLFTHDAMALEAIAALGLACFAGGTAVWRIRDRAR